MSFKAKYAGNCACCLKRFQIGDEVEFVDEQIVIEGHILKLDDSLIGEAEQVCTDCFLIQPKRNFLDGVTVCRVCRGE